MKIEKSTTQKKKDIIFFISSSSHSNSLKARKFCVPLSLQIMQHATSPLARHLLQITTTPAAVTPTTTGADVGLILFIIALILLLGVCVVFFYLHYSDHHFFRHELDFIIYFHPHHASVRHGDSYWLVYKGDHRHAYIHNDTYMKEHFPNAR